MSGESGSFCCEENGLYYIVWRGQIKIFETDYEEVAEFLVKEWNKKNPEIKFHISLGKY